VAGAAHLVFINTSPTEKGKTTTTRQYFLTSRPGERIDPVQILLLRRAQWGIEVTCHQRLDVSLHEDKSRVRGLSAVAVLGLLSRISLALFQQDCQRPQPVRDKTYPAGRAASEGNPGRCWTCCSNPAYPLEPSHPKNPPHTGDGASAPDPEQFCPQRPYAGKTFCIHDPFDFAAGPNTVPVRPNRFLESAVLARVMR